MAQNGGLNGIIQRLANLGTSLLEEASATAWAELSNTLSQFLRLLQPTTSAGDVKAKFRRVHGFETLLNLLDVLAQCWSSQGPLAGEPTKHELKHIEQILALLFEALDDADNEKYFASLGHGSGWKELQEKLLAICESIDSVAQTELFGLLFQLMLNITSVQSIFNEQLLLQNNGVSQTYASSTPSEPISVTDSDFSASIEARVADCFSDIVYIKYPQCCKIILSIWMWLCKKLPTDSRNRMTISLTVLISLRRIVNSSCANAMALHRLGVLDTAVECLLSTQWGMAEHSFLRLLIAELLPMGFYNLSTVSYLVKQAMICQEAGKLLLDAIAFTQQPAHVQFDLRPSGFAAIECGQLKGDFPPVSPSAGFTFTIWLRIEEFDESSHITVFSAFDASQSCFFLAFLERKTHQLVLQTSIKSSKSTARFDSATLYVNHWYHIAIIHERELNRASLILNGVPCQRLACKYPQSPSIASLPTDTTTRSHSVDRAPVQAFLGTPKDMLPRLGKNCSTSRWSVAAAHLFANILPSDLSLVFYHLGPGYHGDFQDCLGSFLTYSASTRLSLEIDGLPPKHPRATIVNNAIRSKAATLVPGSCILLSVCSASQRNRAGTNGVTVGFHTKYQEVSPTSGSPSPDDLQYQNGAVYHADPAVTISKSRTMFMGGTTIYIPESVANDCFKIGGCVSVALEVVAVAASKLEILQSMKIFLALARNNWRNSEAIERENGYGILAWMLCIKFGVIAEDQTTFTTPITLASLSLAENDTLTSDLLQTILDFLGFAAQNTQESLLTNPMAYRALIVDCDLWPQCGPATRRLFQEQFLIFGHVSVHAAFNLKRMNRMRILRRLLDAFKLGRIDRPMITHATHSVITLLSSNDLEADEAMRTIALYITDAVHVTGKIQEGQSTTLLTTLEIGVAVLEEFTSFLTQKQNKQFMMKFARTVSNKWVLHLLGSENVHVVASASKLLAHLLLLYGTSYQAKFEKKTKGFLIMQLRLGRHWYGREIWHSCISIFFGVTEPPDLLSQQSKWALSENSHLCIPMWSVIAAMVEQGLIDLRTSIQMPEHSPALVKAFFSLLLRLHDSCSSVRALVQSAHATRDFLKFLFIGLSSTQEAASAFRDTGEVSDHNSLSSGTGRLHEGKQNLEVSLFDQQINIRRQLRRSSTSYVVVRPSTNDRVEFATPLAPSPAELAEAAHPKDEITQLTAILSTIEDLLAISCIDQIMHRKDFAGLGLFLKAPAAAAIDRTTILSSVVNNITHRLQQELIVNSKSFLETQTLMNIGRFLLQTSEAVFEGWLIDVVGTLNQFIVVLITFLQRPDVKVAKSVRLCDPVLQGAKATLRRNCIFQLSRLSRMANEDTQEEFLLLLVTWKDILFEVTEHDEVTVGSLCFLLLRTLMEPLPTTIHHAALIILQELVRHESDCVSDMLCASGTSGFASELVSRLDRGQEHTLEWIQDRATDIEGILLPECCATWTRYVFEENALCDQSSQIRESRHKERFEQWRTEAESERLLSLELQRNTNMWNQSVSASELARSQRAQQDKQDNRDFLLANFSALRHAHQNLWRSEDDPAPVRWVLDEAEGRDRMRMRLTQVIDIVEETYQPKRTRGKTLVNKDRSNSTASPLSRARRLSERLTEPASPTSQSNAGTKTRSSIAGSSIAEVDDDDPTEAEGFEMLEKQNINGEEDATDPNRKIMRSLRRGERVLQKYNVCRIRGLEALEGILIVGLNNLYIIEGYLLRANDEVINIWQANEEERDPYTTIISGREYKPSRASGGKHHRRHWPWLELASLLKRQFLSRDVALELFFQDGRSCLLTLVSQSLRDRLYSDLVAQHATPKTAITELTHQWRVEQLKSGKALPVSMSKRFTNVFNTSAPLLATTQWMNGEISNFAYLMYINTVLAGRSFNDLTSYPVFPWIIRDYTSEEIDLSDTRIYRDLARPMAGQTSQRETAFRERYDALAAMNDADSPPPFHAGTHYSSAMIVASYLIRLEPFTRSYLMLQGGTFDHAGRLFHSVEKAWLSASQTSMSDVRELVPEFFYLPEFLQNVNGYSFGALDSGEVVGDVILPPWAKGDPHKFIALQRAALESPYVSENLHHWIDLIFGYKQRGQAAVDATNVFHHLSYQGVTNLDAITDPYERLTTVSTINNFGQSCRQVFTRPHEKRQTVSSGSGNDLRGTSGGSHIRPNKSAIAFRWERKIALEQERRHLQKIGQVRVPGRTDVFVSLHQKDQSVRFLSTSENKIHGLFEQLHQQQISRGIFADSHTFITGSDDCTVSVWTVVELRDSFDLQLQITLHGHLLPILDLAVSRALSTLVSCDSDNKVNLWDLNALTSLRCFHCPHKIDMIEINDYNGHVLILCGKRLLLYSINGALLLDQDISPVVNDKVVMCCFLEETSIAQVGDETIYTGYPNGEGTIWYLTLNNQTGWVFCAL